MAGRKVERFPMTLLTKRRLIPAHYGDKSEACRENATSLVEPHSKLAAFTPASIIQHHRAQALHVCYLNIMEHMLLYCYTSSKQPAGNSSMSIYPIYLSQDMYRSGR